MFTQFRHASHHPCAKGAETQWRNNPTARRLMADKAGLVGSGCMPGALLYINASRSCMQMMAARWFPVQEASGEFK
ncbi:MAG: hypothetical protein KDJ48_13415 [Nitratireductor sp.]|nr:hypothetical protein [Nitratireductor sp.]